MILTVMLFPSSSTTYNTATYLPFTSMITSTNLSATKVSFNLHENVYDNTCIQTGGKIEDIDADEDITLVDVEKDKEVVTMDAEPQGRINQEELNVASKDVSATEPTVFNDEKVTMTMAQTLIKLKIIRVGGITEAESFEDMLKGFDREDQVALWNLVKEKFSSVVQSEEKEKALWKLYTDCGVHKVSSTRGHDIFMLIEKAYPLSNGVMILMLSGKLQVEEDNEMARDLVMKIFMEANKPKSKSLDTSSK
nr:hypothetical protein [Tanacetum cinerariifolium]